MGWKSDKNIGRKKAIKLIVSHTIDMSNQELENALISLGFGDNNNLPHFGYNLRVLDHITKEESDDHNDDDDY